MITIRKATLKDISLLSKISIDSFLPAHGDSAPKADMNTYISKNFAPEFFLKELKNKNNNYYLIFYYNVIAGYSKIVFNQSQKKILLKNSTHMSRFYLLKAFYGMGLGKQLFDFNINLCKKNNQTGIWLAVWVENFKAISFYKKMGLKKIDDYNFKISENHYNPNHILYLKF